MTQETFTTIALIIAAIIGGSIIGVAFAANFLKEWMGKEHKHLEEKVTKPITDSNQQLSNNITELLTIQREALTDALKAKDQTLTDTKEQVRVLREQVDDSIANRKELGKQILEIQEKQKQRDATIEEFKRQIAALEETVKSKDGDLATANTTIDNLKRELNEANSTLNNEIAQLRQRVSTLEEQIKAMLQREQQLITENQSLTKQLEEAKATITQKDARIQALEAELASKPIPAEQKSAAADISPAPINVESRSL